jgi:zinc protease
MRICFGALGLSATLGLVTLPSLSASSAPIQVPIQEFRLPNGLRVILSEDHAAPTYSIAVTYNVGSRDEQRGHTGFAHLFEHMMFQGSQNVGKGEHFVLVLNNGGDMNGTTASDRTNYFQTLPANQLDLGLFLEADRMRSLAINQSNLDNQRKAVQEERRLGIDNQPYGLTWETVPQVAYDNFAYQHSTMGSMADLNAATVRDVAEFFRIYYAPNNAVLTLVGDFKTDDALARIKKYFGDVPSQPAPPAPDLTEPEQRAERRRTLTDAFAETPRIDIAFKLPRGNTPDVYAARLAAEILTGGPSSRLFQKLVKEKEVAINVFQASDEVPGPNLLWIAVEARPGVPLPAIEKLIYDEFERLQNEPVAVAEIDKVRMQMRLARVQSLRGTLNRAVQMGEMAVFYDDPGLINTHQEKFDRVTAADIQRVARAYFHPANRTVVTTIPKAKDAQAQAAPPPPQDKGVPLSKVSRLGKAPVSSDVLRVKLPKPVETTLANGLTVMILEDHRLPSVNVQLSIPGAGPIYDPAASPGLANIAAQMLREGTRTRTSRQIAEDTARLGASIDTSATYGSEMLSLAASGLSDNFDQWFALVREILLEPSFPATELAKMKQRVLAELQQQRSDPFFLLNERFKRAVYGAHPAAVVAPTAVALQALRPADLAAWHRERCVPQHAILAISGDVHAATLIPALRQWLAAWKPTVRKVALPADPAPSAARKIYLVDRAGSVQSDAFLGNLGLTRRNPDYIALAVTNRVLGETAASRLFLNLREEKGYTYGAYSFFSAPRYTGTWIGYSSMRTDATSGAMDEFFKELRRIREEPVAEKELEESKRALVAGFALSLEQPTELLGYEITRKVHGLPSDYWDVYPARVYAVTAEAVLRAARKYIHPDTLQVVVVGDGTRLRPVLQKYGPVEVFTTEGTPQKAALR